MFFKVHYHCLATKAKKIVRGSAYVRNKSLLNVLLDRWHQERGDFQFFLLPKDITENLRAQPVELPPLKLGWTGPQQHEYIFNSYLAKTRKAS